MKIKYCNNDGGECYLELEKSIEEVNVLLKVLEKSYDFNYFDGKTGYYGKFVSFRYEVVVDKETKVMEEILVLMFDFESITEAK